MKRGLLIFNLVIAAVLAVIYFALPDPKVEFEDLNNDGIWDDVELRINSEFKNIYLNQAARQIAKEYQEAVLNPSEAKTIERRKAKAESCFEFLASRIDPSQSEKVYGPIRDQVILGRARELRYIDYNVKLSGGVYELLEGDRGNCSFDTSGL